MRENLSKSWLPCLIVSQRWFRSVASNSLLWLKTLIPPRLLHSLRPLLACSHKAPTWLYWSPLCRFVTYQPGHKSRYEIYVRLRFFGGTRGLKLRDLFTPTLAGGHDCPWQAISQGPESWFLNLKKLLCIETGSRLKSRLFSAKEKERLMTYWKSIFIKDIRSIFDFPFYNSL